MVKPNQLHGGTRWIQPGRGGQTVRMVRIGMDWYGVWSDWNQNDHGGA